MFSKQDLVLFTFYLTVVLFAWNWNLTNLVAMFPFISMLSLILLRSLENWYLTKFFTFFSVCLRYTTIYLAIIRHKVTYSLTYFTSKYPQPTSLSFRSIIKFFENEGILKISAPPSTNETIIRSARNIIHKVARVFIFAKNDLLNVLPRVCSPKKTCE